MLLHTFCFMLAVMVINNVNHVTVQILWFRSTVYNNLTICFAFLNAILYGWLKNYDYLWRSDSWPVRKINPSWCALWLWFCLEYCALLPWEKVTVNFVMCYKQWGLLTEFPCFFCSGLWREGGLGDEKGKKQTIIAIKANV